MNSTSLQSASSTWSSTSLTTVATGQPTVSVEPGAKCKDCNKCTDGYTPHLWRKVCRICFCPTECHEGARTIKADAQETTGRVKKRWQPPPKASTESPAKVKSSNSQVLRIRSEFQELERKASVRQEKDASRKAKPKKRNSKDAPTDLSQAAQPQSDQPRSHQQQLDQTLSDQSQPTNEDSSSDQPQQADEDSSVAEKPAFVWSPACLESEQVDEFMEQLPEEIRPVAGQEHEWNKKQMQQMPRHDNLILAEEDPSSEKKEFIKNRETHYCEGSVHEVKMQVCRYCEKDIEDSKLAVQSDLLPTHSWHPGCFRCSTCNEFLVNLVHFIEAGKLYCGRHHAELSRPRCGGCDELIFEQEYTLAGGSKWHTQHFCCFYCDKQLGTAEEEYVTHEGQVVCLPCFDNLLAGRCEACNGKIGAGEHQLSCEDHHWHEGCFKCSGCQTPLDSDDFLMNNGEVYCSECYAGTFGERCEKCGEVIKGKQITASKKHFHLECFTCGECNISLTGLKFYKRDQVLYCAACYDTKFAIACAKCGDYVRSQGLRCKERIYHRDCFVCSKCSISLTACPVVAKPDGVFCHNCAQ